MFPYSNNDVHSIYYQMTIQFNAYIHNKYMARDAILYQMQCECYIDVIGPFYCVNLLCFVLQESTFSLVLNVMGAVVIHYMYIK